MLFDDRTAILTADTVLRSDGWQRAAMGDLSRGFTSSAIWIAGALVNEGAQATTRWISVDPVRLEDVAFYIVDQDGNAANLRYRSGIGAPIADRPLDTVRTAFPITLAPGQQLRYLIRVRSRSSLTLSLYIWHPRNFQVEARRDITAHMLLTGAMLAMSVFSAVLAAVWRDRVFVILTATVVSEVIYELAFEGYLYALLLPQGGDLLVRLPSVAGNIAVALFSALLYSFIGLDRFCVWRWAYKIMIAAFVVASAWTAFGDYRTSAAV
ncbi:7TM-DISM domain-containing protein, partial [Burkholderia glumae]